MSVSSEIATAVATVGGLAASIGTLAALKDRAPIKWVLKRLVVAPAEEMQKRVAVQVFEEQMRPVVAAVEVMGSKISAIHYEMHPNGGESMRDAIDRSEHRGAVVMRRAEQVATDVVTVKERLTRVEGQVDVLVRRD